MTSSIQDQALKQVADIFDQHVPFHNLLGLDIKHYDINGVEVVIKMKPELIGNIHQNILHGGVTATLLDVVGGLTAFAGLVASRDDWTVEELQQRLTTLGTIDMRVDFLRPGRGETFTGTGTVIRAGNRVSVCKMELHNELGTHIAFGTGTYMVG
ncbi:thioesterase family protein [Shewanella phaeophyticola]|uniref:Medium/long-chain acyl-CoA thioesterase YigI n=1 Tax=Shewanella phaeophyticola TaxID=2978345 RepID=A0ABT2P5V6_9GAMM|nr:thioesterase family protein [Shewanella sp. KJ10-1]MCT8988051.1 thioesterase family protein [Shewanella sp. KJ10-1]